MANNYNSNNEDKIKKLKALFNQSDKQKEENKVLFNFPPKGEGRPYIQEEIEKIDKIDKNLSPEEWLKEHDKIINKDKIFHDQEEDSQVKDRYVIMTDPYATDEEVNKANVTIYKKGYDNEIDTTGMSSNLSINNVVPKGSGKITFEDGGNFPELPDHIKDKLSAHGCDKAKIEYNIDMNIKNGQLPQDFRIQQQKEAAKRLLATTGIEHKQAFEFYDNLTFSKALEAMKRGHKVRRSNWKNKSIVLNGDDIQWHFDEGDNDYIKSYVLNNSDILSEDWEIVQDEIDVIETK